MNFRERAFIVGGVTAANIAIDQLTKSLAIRYLKDTPPQIFLGDIFRLQYSENPGAFLSLGSAMSEGMRFWLLTVSVGLFLIGLLVYLLRSPDVTRIQIWALSLIAGGGLSNLIDRSLRTNGQVVDFMNMGIGELRTGIFNVADMAIMAGTGLFLLAAFREEKPTPPGT